MENTVTISAEEYKSLICTECRFNDTLDALAKAERDNIHLKDFILNIIVSDFKMKNYDIDELTNPQDFGFPFEYKDLVNAGISVEYAVKWIKNKMAEKEEENGHGGTEE